MALLIIGVLLLVVREHFDPRLSLYASDVLSSAPPPLTAPLSPDLTLRLYATAQPHVGKIASLQKGLVLVHEGRALIEEGYGFGLPIIEVDGVAYVSRHAHTSLIRQGPNLTLEKAFRIDVADRPTRFLHVKYQDVQPLGTVVFSYTLQPPDLIDVTVNFSGLEADWDRAYLMNEQGARAFTRYRNPAGVSRGGDDVGIWQEATAPFGCWEAPTHDVRFCVEAPEGQPGFIGRERYKQYNWLGIYSLSWSGIDIQVEAPLETYAYAIRVDRRAGARYGFLSELVQDAPDSVPNTMDNPGQWHVRGSTDARTVLKGAPLEK
jgi:hypothetical protein